MSDLIDRQRAIEAVKLGITYAKLIDTETGELLEPFKASNDELKRAVQRIKNLPSAQPTFDARDTQYNLPIGTDCISRQAAIDDENTKGSGKMRVLIACEESQRICKAFRERGHEAYSCDILECSGGHPEWHIQRDVLAIINGNCEFETADGQRHRIDSKWDLLIAHPPCTYLSNVATRQYSLKCCTAEKVIARWEERARAAVFFMQFALADCDRIAVENPVGFMNSSYRKPDQIIHPYFFAESEGDAENYHEKRTCLWLKGLPQLERSNSLPSPPPMYILQGEKGKGKKIGWCEGMRNIKGGQAERAKARSKTFPGIAKAMAEQWG